MTLMGVIYEAELYDCFADRENARCNTFRAVDDGALLASARWLADGYSARLGALRIRQYVRGDAEEQALGITRTPTLVVFDQERQAALGKLSGNITSRKVSDLFYRLAQFEYSPSEEGYVQPNGTTAGADEIFEANGGGGLSLGIPGGTLADLFGGCAPWMPGVLCRLKTIVAVLLLIMAVIVVRKIIR